VVKQPLAIIPQFDEVHPWLREFAIEYSDSQLSRFQRVRMLEGDFTQGIASSGIGAHDDQLDLTLRFFISKQYI
jgi:hypothetical protein